MMDTYAGPQPARAEIDASKGALVLEFGADWCTFCQAAQPLIRDALPSPGVQHRKVEDGKGRPLGRSFGVRLWPTLVFLKDGVERARLVRPATAEQIREAVHTIG